MTKNITDATSSVETDLQRFTRVLSRPHFKPLREVFENLKVETTALHAAVLIASSYATLLGKTGYRLEVVKQIHENDCYSRLGPKGGIRAVLPVHDSASYSTMVTLVNFDSSVMTTPNSVLFYDHQLAEFKTQLMIKTGQG
ncbi:MAG: hypothetical protein H7Y43_12965 [Akkermansiaceae bacterium]|nr:hypothetical protein [Verrucomicrobiales bacterium]